MARRPPSRGKAHRISKPDPKSDTKSSVERMIAGMSVDEKVGQLLIVGFAGTEVNDQIRLWVQQRHIGGIALFSRNIVNVEQTMRFTRDLHALTARRIPLFVALDQEGGTVARVKDGALALPGNMTLGASRDPLLAFVAGQALAVDLRRLGFNMNLAPVLDVNSNPQNPVIGVRSYGERPDLVGQLGAWYVRGQQEMGVVAVAKHFPGHGDTQSDSHYAMPSVGADMKRLQQLELVPFRQAVDAGLDAVMTAHIALPAVSENATIPATLSQRVITGILRRQLGFQGIVMTDGLEMQGVANRYGSGRAAVLAILAGGDMPMVLWTDETREDVYRSLLRAVRTGEISRERLDQSVRRILTVKFNRNLFDAQYVPPALARVGQHDLHAQVADRIARAGVTLVRNEGDLLPLARSGGATKTVVLAPPGAFSNRMARASGITVVEVPMVPSRQRRRDEAMRLVALLQNADTFVAAVVNRYHLEIVGQVMKKLPKKPLALVSFASPYFLAEIPQADAYVCTYSYLDVAQNAAAEALLGEFRMTGRLPVSIPGYYPYGHHVEEGLARAPLAEVQPHVE
jgi:beta-N-acetylhexosaminidase